jgi:heterodisulfide reductase subunit D
MDQGEKNLAYSENKKGKRELSKITRRQMIELDTCSHCALCTEQCPVYHESKNPLHAPGVRSAQIIKLWNKKFSFLNKLLGEKEITEKDIKDLSESAYHCSLCGRCMESCPFGFQTHELWIKVRNIVSAFDGNPRNVKHLNKLLNESMNPYGLEPDTRLDWSYFVDIEVPQKESAKIVYFVGCTTAYKGVNHDVAFSMCSILEELGEEWSLLGEDEWCCGNPSLISGNREEAEVFAKHNVQVLEAKGVEKVITGCAGCYRVFKFEYPYLLKRKLGFETVHAVEYIRDKIVSGDLVLNTNEKRVIYHDPCELSRLGGLIKEPREILGKLTKDQIEFEEYGVDVKCCGGGGLLQVVDNNQRLSIVKERLNEALDKEAEILVSTCPACKLAFTDGVREFNYNIKILDLIELVAKQLEL